MMNHTRDSAVDVALITVTYNSAQVLDGFLKSMAQQDPSLSIKVIVMDNASKDGTVDLLKQITVPEYEIYYLDENIGVAAANNIGLKRAKELGAKSIIMLNNDIEFGPDLVTKLHAWLEANPDTAVSPLIPYHSFPDKIWYGGGEYQWWKGYIGYHEHQMADISSFPSKPFQTGYAPTTCLAFPAAWLDVVGYQDERYFIYWEDTDYCFRMKAHGMRIFVDPTTILTHKVSQSTGGPSNPITLRYIFRNNILFVRKFHGRATVLMTFGIMVVRMIGAVLTGRSTISQTRIKFTAMGEAMRLPIQREAI